MFMGFSVLFVMPVNYATSDDLIVLGKGHAQFTYQIQTVDGLILVMTV